MTTTALTPWRERYLVFGAPHIGPAERDEVLACIDSGWLGTGPRAARLEREFAAYIGAPVAVGLSSGTAALHLALLALDLPQGAEVITTSMTFCATANAIVHAGATPVFADCERMTLNIDLDDVRRKVTPRTRALVPVHFAGRPCDMSALGAIAREHDLAIVEDCAHAIEATIDGRHCGTFGDLGCFSFYVTKNLTTVEGGMVVARDPARAERIPVLALHGLSKNAWHRYGDDGYEHYEVVTPGFKYNLTDLAASIGIHQLARLEENWTRRRALWDYYLGALADLPLVLPAPVPANVRHAYHLFTCIVDDRRTAVTRDQVLARLHALRIGAGVHYRAVHEHRYYRETYGARSTGSLPNAEWVSARTFSIPLSPAVTDADAEDVARALRMVFR
jgi:dTDP-4-amino-4,6-dideoxygalactose transaminase